MVEATRQLALDRVHWVTQQGGDGELAILPVDTSEPTIVAYLAPTLDRLLRESNRHLMPEARVRMRIALHVGLVHLDGATGFPGSAVVTVCRLVNAPPLKRALELYPAAAVVQIVSEPLYEDIVRNRYEGLRPDRYTRVPVELPDKGFRSTAWITVPDEDIRALAQAGTTTEPATPEPTPPTAAAPAPAPRGTGGSTFNFGTVTTHGPTAFGDYSQASGGSPEPPTNPGEDR